MPIKIKVGDAVDAGKITVSLNARKTLDGNILVMDHTEVDIAVIPGKSKVVTFPKKSLNDAVYSMQERFFNYLASKGVIKRESIRSGNVYGSLEAEFPDSSSSADAVQTVVFVISKFIEEERPHMKIEKYTADEFEEQITDPDSDESTELGEVPHEEDKGIIPKTQNPAYRKTYSGNGVGGY